MKSNKLTLNLIFVAICFAAFALYMILMPYSGDDYWYMSGIRNSLEGNGGSVWNEIWEVIKFHYCEDNARVCNMLLVPLLLLPKWVGSTLMVAAWCGAVWCCMRIIGGRWREGILAPLALLCFTFLMPWQEEMFTLTFQINYMMGGFLGAVCVWWIAFRGREKGAKRWVAFCLGLLAGLWQEAIAAPVWGGFVALYICYARWRNPGVVMMCAGLLVGVIWNLLSPNYIAVISGNSPESVEGGITIKRVAGMVLRHPSLIWALIAAVVAFIRKRAVLKEWPVLFLAVSAIASFAIGLVSRYVARAGWWCDMASVMLILYFVREMLASGFGNGKRWKYLGRCVGGVMFLVVACYWIVADTYVNRYESQLRSVFAQYESNPEGRVYCTWPSLWGSPRYMPEVWEASFYRHPLWWVARYVYPSEGMDKHPIQLLPASSRTLVASEEERVTGDVGAFWHQGFLYAPAGNFSDDNWGIANIEVSAGKMKYMVEFCRVRFKSETDGESYVVLYPTSHLGWLRNLPIKSLSFAQ